MKYDFAFYTGYGYREVWSHTIKDYHIKINADNDKEAIKKVLKKRQSLVQYNKCFSNDRGGVQLNKRVGILFSPEGIIRWQGEKIYKPPVSYPSFVMYEHTVSESEYGISYFDWAARNIIQYHFPSRFAYLQNRFDGIPHSTLLFGPDERLTVLHQQIDYFLEHEKNLSEEEVQQIKELKHETDASINKLGQSPC